MNTYIITGASRGIGKEMALQLARNGNQLILIARSTMDDLAKQIQEKGGKAKIVQADLSKPQSLEDLADQVFNIDNIDASKKIVLINNAGMIAPMGMIGKYDASSYLANLQVNFTSAVMLCHLFIQKVQKWDCNKIIMNISSGAANKPYPGWGHYCSTKAGLNMFTSCIHEEQRAAAKPVLAAAYNPGRTDTKMQEEIREQNSEDFPKAQSFVDAWKQGILNDPEKVAAHIVETIEKQDYPSGKVVSYR